MAMTISQALRRLAAVKGEMAEAMQRCSSGVRYKRDEPPSFPYRASMERYKTLQQELIRLKAGIQLANARNSVAWRGQPIALTYALVLLNELKAEKTLIAHIHGCSTAAEFSLTEKDVDYVDGKQVITKSTVAMVCELTEIQQDTLRKKLQAEFDELNMLVEEANGKAIIPSLE